MTGRTALLCAVLGALAVFGLVQHLRRAIRLRRIQQAWDRVQATGFPMERIGPRPKTLADAVELHDRVTGR